MPLRRVIPVLLLKGKGLVKTKRFSDPVYVGDPINAVKIFNEKEVDEIIILDIEASRTNRKPDFQLIRELASECFMPMAYGGGIKTAEEAKQIFDCGVEKISLNTSAFLKPQLINEIAKSYGSQSVIVSVDYKKNLFGKNQVVIPGERGTQKTDPLRYAKIAEDSGAGEILLNSIDRDGMLSGYDTEMIHAVSEVLSIPLTVCGGARNTDDFVQAITQGASAVAAGSMFVFHGRHQAVLLSFPSQEELKAKLFSL
jgi:cyclase